MEEKILDCVFCKIADHQVSANIRFEDDEMIAFDDINPSAPIHVLLIPKVHIQSLATVGESDQALLGRMLYRAKLLAETLNIAESGYRVTINVGKWGGQIVPHFHLHILGGAPLSTHLETLSKADVLVAPPARSEIRGWRLLLSRLSFGYVKLRETQRKGELRGDDSPV